MPGNYLQLFTDMPPAVQFVDDAEMKKDVIHFFTKSQEEYRSVLPKLMQQLRPDGMIWVSWPKKSSKVVTDITEHLIRGFAIKTGLVDIKICAVDEIWSGLKMVIPVKDRQYSA